MRELLKSIQEIARRSSYVKKRPVLFAGVMTKARTKFLFYENSEIFDIPSPCITPVIIPEA